MASRAPLSRGASRHRHDQRRSARRSPPSLAHSPRLDRPFGLPRHLRSLATASAARLGGCSSGTARPRSQSPSWPRRRPMLVRALADTRPRRPDGLCSGAARVARSPDEALRPNAPRWESGEGPRRHQHVPDPCATVVRHVRGGAGVCASAGRSIGRRARRPRWTYPDLLRRRRSQAAGCGSARRLMMLSTHITAWPGPSG